MPKAQKVYGVRLTKPRRATNRNKLDGRPKGTLKRFKFEETRLGFMLLYETPVVYNLIMQSTPNSPFPDPSPDVIEIIAKASKDPSFQKKKFTRYLEEYREHGLYCRRGKKLTPERKAYYESVRNQKLKKFISNNRKKIKTLKKRLML